jgi:hypothetical protein
VSAIGELHGEAPAVVEDEVQSQRFAKVFALVGDVVDVAQVLFGDVIASAEGLVAEFYFEGVCGPVVAESGDVHFAHFGVELLADEQWGFDGRADFCWEEVEVAGQLAGSWYASAASRGEV